jgi:hypothetical protein
VSDLQYLQGKATSLGGLRPKCSLIDENGALAIGKFPSVKDERSIVRAEVLALRLLAHAGSVSAAARAITIDEVDIAVIQRFDRVAEGARIPYLSGGSLLQARRDEDRAYTELADAIRRISAAPAEDLRELWRRLVINLLITNVDDHLCSPKRAWITAIALPTAPVRDGAPLKPGANIGDIMIVISLLAMSSLARRARKTGAVRLCPKWI